MSSRLKRAVWAIGWAAFVSVSAAIAGVLGWSDSALLRILQRTIAFLDLPISAIGLLLPFKGAWLFFVPPNHDRGIAPDLFRILMNQVLIGVPTYLAVFWLVRRLARLAGARRQGEKVALSSRGDSLQNRPGTWFTQRGDK